MQPNHKLSKKVEGKARRKVSSVYKRVRQLRLGCSDDCFSFKQYLTNVVNAVITQTL